jgi:hypothetical protein
MVASAFAWSQHAALDRSPLTEFGLSSLFVYWVHLELVYGRPAAALREQLEPGWQLAAFAVFSLFLYALVTLKQRWAPILRMPHFRRTSTPAPAPAPRDPGRSHQGVGQSSRRGS